MAVPENLSIQFEDYPQLTFIPLGRKNKTVRSLSTKKTKALLTRLNEAVLLALQTYSIDEQLLLNSFLYNNAADGFPIPIDRMETIYPHLWKPQSFLWKDYNKNRGVPIHEHEFYPEDFSNMSKEDLHSYVSKLVKEYMFCARIHDSSREEWLLHVNSRFFDHPLVSLYNRNKEAIQAMEKCEDSPLLFLMKDPEKVAHFRNRLEVGLRPFRSLPYEAFECGIKTCVKESTIQIVPDQEVLLVHCSSLDLSVTYHIIDDCVTLREEFHIVLVQ
ncbi:RQC-minor-2 family DNA-binding protein [Priestia flexa]|nr:RQC-minor-2 family DNA-binding protein [Priestia flexa]